MPAEVEPTLINKVQDVDAVIRNVNRNLKGRNRSSRLFKAAIFLLFVAIFISGGLFFFYQERPPKYIEPSLNEKSSVYNDYEIEKPSIFLSQSNALDLSEVDGVSILAFNPVNYQIYADSNSREKRKIASLTKLMTASVALEIFDENTVFEMKGEFPDEVVNGIGLEIGDKMRFEDVLSSLLIGSSNDVAMLIAQNHPDGYEAFVSEMNLKAQALGMFDSSFSNPMGYDHVNNYSTAWDLKKLAIYSINNEKILNVVSVQDETVDIIKKDGTVRDVKIKTTNMLLEQSPSVKGLKTGYTTDAGQCFIGYFVGEGDDQLITIILGTSENRFDETLDLFESINNSFGN